MIMIGGETMYQFFVVYLNVIITLMINSLTCYLQTMIMYGYGYVIAVNYPLVMG